MCTPQRNLATSDCSKATNNPASFRSLHNLRMELHLTSGFQSSQRRQTDTRTRKRSPTCCASLQNLGFNPSSSRNFSSPPMFRSNCASSSHTLTTTQVWKDQTRDSTFFTTLKYTKGAVFPCVLVPLCEPELEHGANLIGRIRPPEVRGVQVFPNDAL